MASQMSSSTPSPPNDAETKTIIDKLANFVARNGPEFERMTMEKKRDDPKFSFLFGGVNNPYYRWKVEMESSEQIAKSDSSRISSGQPSVTTGTPIPDSSAQLIEALNAVKCKEQDDVRKNETTLDPFEVEFNRVVQPVMNTCSKEAIASGKSWILSRSHSAEDCGKMAHYMMRRSLEYPGVEFSHKLHLVYLINDILYHGLSASLQEGNDLKQAIQTVIVQIMFNVFTTNPEKANELVKMVNIWESQNCLNADRLNQIRTVLNYPIDKLPVPEPCTNKQQQPVVPPPDPTPSQPPWLQYSNQFQQSSWQPPQPPQYSSWDQQPPPVPPNIPPHPPPSGPPGVATSHTQPPPPWVGHQNPPPPPWTHPPLPQQPVEPTPLFAPSENFVAPPPTDDALPPPVMPPSDNHHEIPDDNVDLPMGGTSIDYNHKPSGPLLPPPTNTDPVDYHQSSGIQVFDYQHRPANWRDMPGPLPMGGRPRPSFPFSTGPPPFFPRPPFHPHDIPPHVAPPPPPPPPSLPYFDLPAGLMIPLVPLHEHDYTPLKPHQVCLPAPQPPSERLLEAVEEFYYPPSQEKPRNEEGWEAKALLDFYNAKEKAKERSRDARRSSRRRRSRSNSPRRKKRRSSSRSPSPSRRRRRRSSRSPSSSSSDSRSPSPYKRRQRRHSSSDSSSDSLSPSTPTIEELAYRSKYKTNTPQSSKEDSLKADNVGHQLLKRMGWEGAGLGARGQGIQEPIKGGEARDKLNQYSGVGINMKDPFEQFRRNKSYTFNRRPPGGASEGVPHE